MLRIPLPEYADGTLYRAQEYGFNTINTRMRCSFRNTMLRTRKSNASAKQSSAREVLRTS